MFCAHHCEVDTAIIKAVPVKRKKKLTFSKRCNLHQSSDTISFLDVKIISDEISITKMANCFKTSVTVHYRHYLYTCRKLVKTIHDKKNFALLIGLKGVHFLK